MRLSPSSCACHSRLHSSYFNIWSRGRRRATTSCAQHQHSGDGARRPTLILPGFLQGALSYQSLQDALAPYSAGVSILPIAQTDWIPALQGKPFDWYLDLLDEEADKLLDGAESNQLNIVAHSAGGGSFAYGSANTHITERCTPEETASRAPYAWGVRTQARSFTLLDVSKRTDSGKVQT